MGTETAWASRYAEKSHGNDSNPPKSRTIDGTAVATMVESMATSPVDSIRAIRMGPRSERNPTPWVRAVIISLVSVSWVPVTSTLGTHDRRRLSPALVSVQESGAPDEAKVRVRLRVVAQMGLRAGIVFL